MVGNVNDVFFFVFIYDGWVVFEVLCIFRNDSYMFGSIKVFDLNDVFVRVFVVEWVVVDFNEGIDVVNVFFGSCDLGDVVFVLGF